MSLKRALVVVLSLPLAVAAVPASAAVQRWRLPVDGDVLTPYAVGPDRYAAGQHRGVDLAAPPGTPVRAACSGRVSFAGRVPRGGRTVSVRCGRLVSTYQHLGAVSVRRGARVAAGARLGVVGRARPRPHVHLGARVAATGAYLDPLALVSSEPRGPPPLLPAARPRTAPPAAPPRAVPPVAERVPRAVVRPLPWPVWAGFGLVALGLPLGGVVRLRARRARPCGAWRATATD